MVIEEKKARILIVDDEKMNLKVLADLLKNEHSVILARSGAQALKHAFGENPPDLILLDVMMPDMGGYEVIKCLKDNDRTNAIPVIFVTALNSMEDEEHGLKLGAMDYITKPFSPPIVEMRVRNHLRIVHQYRLLDQLAYLDGLTEIPNRRRFEEVFKNECLRAIRNRSPLSIGMADVDFFKQYNDHYGHAMGDRTLQAIARVLHNSVKRPADLVARYGGEEFVMIFPDTDRDSANLVADRIRLSIEELNISHQYSGIADHITISIGLATARLTNEFRPESILEKADINLYTAKQSGRNMVVSSLVSP
ncbi:diguanylate cyclase [Desulfopila inferna]|uniref:diguanylate cyclase n=1 Tax=Desulfopila inferna TaxID=468528 RepID=UPI00196649C0|nr:diguanylate cyclase [Desulfopila inferna]MBM9605301.1 diguanylate cyclase [Desulfopila inferna]